MKLTTQHLEFEHGFVSIIQADGDNVECGRISPAGRRTTCLWPWNMGSEPEWFETEVDELMELVGIEHDKAKYENRDYESQVNADYLRGKGAK
jgi:hypothetical protein